MNEQHPRILDDATLTAIGQRRALAHREISRICSGERRWTMTVPVQEDDSDMLFSDVLTDNDTLVKEVYRLRGALKRVYIDYWGELPEDMKAFIKAALYGTEDAVSALAESEDSDG